MKNLEKEAVVNFLQKIEEDIVYNIDGGCNSCTSEFVDGINKTLVKEYSIKLFFNKENKTLEIFEL